MTEADLDALVVRFSAADAVPVKIEHAASPLDPVGLVKRLWREGNALMGRLAFPPDLAGFLERRGIAKLSVGPGPRAADPGRSVPGAAAPRGGGDAAE